MFRKNKSLLYSEPSNNHWNCSNFFIACPKQIANFMEFWPPLKLHYGGEIDPRLKLRLL